MWALCEQGNVEHPRLCGRASPTAQVPNTEIWLPARSALLAMGWGGSRWEAVAVQVLSKLAEGWLLLVLLALMLFLVASCPHVHLSEWEILVYILFSSHLEDLTEMRFWAFTSLSVLFCNIPWKLGGKTHTAIFILLQFSWGFGARAGVTHFTVSCWCAKIPQKDSLHCWKQEVTGISGARLFLWPLWGSFTDSTVRSSHTVQVFLECFIGVKLHSICYLLTARSL